MRKLSDSAATESAIRKHILQKLRQQGENSWLSGESLSFELGISRAAVNKHVLVLREHGSIIESLPRRGYRLISEADAWADANVREGLTTQHLGRGRWLWHKKAGSTNQIAVLEALGGAEEGLVVVARQQNDGRGEHGHRWLSLPGSLMFSVLIRPSIAIDKLADFPKMAQYASALAIRKICMVDVKCVRENDLYLNNRKIGGILVESLIQNDEIKWIVIGIGLNINTPKSFFPKEIFETASSLYAETGIPWSFTVLLKKHLEELEDAFYK